MYDLFLFYISYNFYYPKLEFVVRSYTLFWEQEH